MSVFSYNHAPRANRVPRSIALFLGGTMLLGGCSSLSKTLGFTSEVVAGVPGQIESHSSEEVCTGHIKTICAGHEMQYRLHVEQCPQDVTAAEQGRQSLSIDPRIGAIGAGCLEDTVKVKQETYNSLSDGTVTTFTGPVGDSLPH